MGQLGNQTTGFNFTVGGAFGDAAGGNYGVPSPGIFVTGIHCFAGNNGSASTDRLYVWKDNGSGRAGSWLVRSGTFNMGAQAWQARTDISVNTGQLSADGYIPAGTNVWIGIYASTGILSFQGTNTGTTDLGNTADGDFSFNAVAGGGLGWLAAYIDYTPLGAPSISGLSVTHGVAGDTVVLTGSGFLHATGVSLNGVGASNTINSDGQITATVPVGASTGTWSVSNPAGSGSSSTFVVSTVFSFSGTQWMALDVDAFDGTAEQLVQVLAFDATNWQQIG